MRCAIGLDIGGTKVAAGVVDPAGQILARIAAPTPADLSEAGTMALLLGMIGELTSACPDVQAIGAGAAGIIEWPAGRIQWAANNRYTDLPLRALLAGRTGLPVVVDNDANTAAWAEARVGAGAGFRDLAMLTVGTGIGSGFVLDGRLCRGRDGAGYELGHIIVDPDGDRCGCGKTGCLETVASGSALARAGRRAAREHPGSMLATMTAAGPGLTGEAVHAAAAAGDAAACSLFGHAGHWLSVGIAFLQTWLDVEIVIIGGGLSAAGELLLAPLRDSLRQLAFGPAGRPATPIAAAALGPDAGLIGAGLLALDQLPPHAR